MSFLLFFVRRFILEGQSIFLNVLASASTFQIDLQLFEIETIISKDLERNEDGEKLDFDFKFLTI